MRTTWGVAVALAACGSHAAAPDAAPAPPDAAGVAHVRVLAFNDLHGALDPNVDGAGGVARLAGEIDALRTPTTVVVAAGDLVGGSPLASAYYHDMPTIEAVNALGLDLSSIGNHEFDEGTAELHRLQDGGCHPVDGCAPGDAFAGATFHYLAANVVDTTTGDTVFPPYELRDVDGVRIAFVGETLEGTALATAAARIPELSFGDEVATYEALLPELRAAGAQVFVLLLHQGGATSGEGTACVAPTGEIFPIAQALDGEVDVIASAHSHKAYDCRVGGVVVTQADSKGTWLTQIDLDVDRATGAIVAVTTENHLVDASVTPDPDVDAIVQHYDALIAPIASAPFGSVTADITRAIDLAGESELGDVVTDAMRAAGGSDVALMNNGGLRADLLYAPDGQITYGEAFAAQPFGNQVWTATMTGADLVAALNQLFESATFQVSGLTFAWSASATPGQQIDAANVTVGGVALDPTASYRVTANEIITQLIPAIWASVPDATLTGTDLDLLAAYFTAQSPVAPPPLDRVTKLP
jgi:5'-nucleotidase